MIQMNIEIGQKIGNVKCCGENPIICEYNETYCVFRITYQCRLCQKKGSFSLAIPKSVRDKEFKRIQDLDELKKRSGWTIKFHDKSCEFRPERIEVFLTETDALSYIDYLSNQIKEAWLKIENDKKDKDNGVG